MKWFYNAKLSAKLFMAFALCALFTLGVGVIGSRGISALSVSLDNVFTNSLLSVTKTGEVKASVIAQNRDLYRLLAAMAGNAPQSVKDDILASMTVNRTQAEKATPPTGLRRLKMTSALPVIRWTETGLAIRHSSSKPKVLPCPEILQGQERSSTVMYAAVT